MSDREQPSHQHQHEHAHHSPAQAAVADSLLRLTERGDLSWRMSALRELSCELDGLRLMLDLDRERLLIVTTEGQYVGALAAPRSLYQTALRQPGLALAKAEVDAHLNRIISLAPPPVLPR